MNPIPEGLSALAYLDDGVALYCSEPRPCGICRDPHTYFRNRDGRTRCAFCDLRYVKSGRQLELTPIPGAAVPNLAPAATEAA